MAKSKNEWTTIQAIPGSIVITPKELKVFEQHGINVLKALRRVQKEIRKKPL